jgi:hypothetical protein
MQEMGVMLLLEVPLGDLVEVAVEPVGMGTVDPLIPVRLGSLLPFLRT